MEDPGKHYDFTHATEMRGPGSGSHNTIRNCTMAYCDGGSLVVAGRHDLLENVLAHDLDTSGVGYHTFHFQQAKDAVIRSLTAYNAGASEFINAGRRNVVELCDIGAQVGSLQQDVTPEEAELLKRTVSAKGFHYFGSGRFFILAGKTFADTMVGLLR